MTPNAEQVMACQQSAATALDSAACLLAAFRRLGVPSAMLDVGCGDGHLVRIAASLGASATGWDVSAEMERGRIGGADYAVLPRDLQQRHVALPRDLVLCLEVAEHLPPEAAETLCDTLADVTGKTLLFSAATPGQGGSGHLNEQPHDYWRGLLSARGLVEDEALTAELRREWKSCAPRAPWYGRNVMAFRRPR